MPVLLWSERDGVRATEVRTGRSVRLSAEEFRAEAEELDPQLDALLDQALLLLNVYADHKRATPLLKAWVLGRAVRQSEVLESEALRDEIRELLWQALAHKCWYRLRANGSLCHSWRQLRPVTDNMADPQLSRGKRRIYEDFEIGLWLQEQEYNDAALIFGGKIKCAKELYRRPAQRHLDVRFAIQVWLEHQSDEMRSRLSKTKEFSEIIKALSRIFPSRGPGSARLPQYLDHERLQCLVSEALDQHFGI